MKQDQVLSDISALLRARNTLIWIVSREELRVERALIDVAGSLKMVPKFWDCADGMTRGDGSPDDARLTDPLEALKTIGGDTQRAIYIMRDLHKWLDPQVLRSLRSLARKLQGAEQAEARAVIVLSSSSEIPPELAGQATVVDWPLPDREEMGAILDSIVESLSDDLRSEALPLNGAREAAIDAAVGLTAEQAANSYAKSLVTERRIDAALVSAEKQRVVSSSKVLTWFQPDPRGLDSVGGLDVLKAWLAARKLSLSAAARAYGLPAPKGVFLVGPPGTGKSQTAKAIATAWGLPLLRMDLNAAKSKFVGESEQNIREAFNLAETVAPCFLWIDEIDKVLAGSTGPQGDGGVGADALGTFLSWMQDHTAPVFVIATANDVTALPPALLRKGRFDEFFFVDMPTAVERAEIVRASLLAYGREAEAEAIMADANLADVVAATEGFNGAEIHALVPDALFVAFADDERPINALDLLAAAKGVVPLSATAKESIDGLRTWATGRCRFASTPETTKARSDTRSIEV